MQIDPNKIASMLTQQAKVSPQKTEATAQPVVDEKLPEKPQILQEDQLSLRSSYRASYARLETQQNEVSAYQVADQTLARMQDSVDTWKEDNQPEIFNQELKTLFSEMQWEDEFLYEDKAEQLFYDENQSTGFQDHLETVRLQLTQLHEENQGNLDTAQQKLLYTLIEMENIEAASNSQNLQEVYEQLNELKQPTSVHEQASPEALLNLLS